MAIERTQEGEKNERKRTTATLVFKTLQPDDMHNYICEASNTVGTDQATTYVEVKCEWLCVLIFLTLSASVVQALRLLNNFFFTVCSKCK